MLMFGFPDARQGEDLALPRSHEILAHHYMHRGCATLWCASKYPDSRVADGDASTNSGAGAGAGAGRGATVEVGEPRGEREVRKEVLPLPSVAAWLDRALDDSSAAPQCFQAVLPTHTSWDP